MTDNDVLTRLGLVKTQRWSRDVFTEHYGVDLWGASSSAGAQFRIWAERFRDGSQVIGLEDVDRWKFDRFLVQREWLPVNLAACQFAMDVDQMMNVLTEMAANHWISDQMIAGEVLGLYPSSFLRDLPKRLPSFPRKIFSSQSSYVRAFHEAIKADIPGMEVPLLTCTASRDLGEAPPDVAYERDIITGDPIGIRHQIWLNFGKPLALRPDACSVFTFVRHEEVLKEYSMGGAGDDRLQAVRGALARQEG